MEQEIFDSGVERKEDKKDTDEEKGMQASSWSVGPDRPWRKAQLLETRPQDS